MTKNVRRVPLPSLTRRLVELADAGELTVTRFRREAPRLSSQLDRDADHAALRSLWGRTRNFDENACARIVHPTILECIGAIAGVPMTEASAHSGHMHTYGYLLTNLRTPYGTKRTRWTSPALGRALGVGGDTLRPYPGDGTLLANLTWTLGRIAFDDDTAEQRRCEELATAVPSRLLGFCPPARDRLTESIGGETNTELQTDLVALRPERADAARLLVYSIRRTSNRGRTTHRLLTAFPVSTATVTTLRALGRSREPIRLRYNAHDPKLSGRDLAGERRWQSIRAG